MGLYGLLYERWPSPVVRLNRAVALSFTEGPEAALSDLDDLSLEPQLASYPYLAATRADFLRRLGRDEEAVKCYEEALMFTENRVEREFLAARIDELDTPGNRSS